MQKLRFIFHPIYKIDLCRFALQLIMNILLYILLHYTKTLLDVLFTSSGGHCFYSNIHTIIHEVNVSNEYECLWKNNATVRFIIGIPWLMIIDAIPHYPRKPIWFLTLVFIEVQARSCKRSETLFQISLLLFSTWREYSYSQPTNFYS